MDRFPMNARVPFSGYSLQECAIEGKVARVVCFAVLFGVCLSCCFEFLWVGARALRERDITVVLYFE